LSKFQKNLACLPKYSIHVVRFNQPTNMEYVFMYIENITFL